jgi:hypothetical protein
MRVGYVLNAGRSKSNFFCPPHTTLALAHWCAPTTKLALFLPAKLAKLRVFYSGANTASNGERSCPLDLPIACVFPRNTTTPVVLNRAPAHDLNPGSIHHIRTFAFVASFPPFFAHSAMSNSIEGAIPTLPQLQKCSQVAANLQRLRTAPQ